MNAMEIGQAMVTAVNSGPDAEWAFVEAYYAPDVVSVEGQDSPEMPAQVQGMDAIRGKHEWWYANHDVHEVVAEGPFVGLRDDQYAVRFMMDATPKGGERMQMVEVALYTVRDDRIAREEYLYLMA